MKKIIVVAAATVLAVIALLSWLGGRDNTPPTVNGGVAPISRTASPSSSPIPSASSETIGDAGRIAAPATRYVTALHHMDTTIDCPGWSASEFDGIVAGDLAKTTKLRVASAEQECGKWTNDYTWAKSNSMVSTVEVTSVDVKRLHGTDDQYLVDVAWRLHQTGDQYPEAGQLGANQFTVVTVAKQADGSFKAVSDEQPQG